MSAVATGLLVAAAAAVGSALRYLAARALDHGALPWGTLLVNLAGSAALGALAGSPVTATTTTVFGVGLCGGLTTYSAFAVQTAERALSGARRRAASYALVTVGGCLLAAAAGWAVAAALSGTGRAACPTHTPAAAPTARPAARGTA